MRSLDLCLLVAAILVSPILSADAPDSDLLDLSLEDLMNIEVTSVSKREQALSDAPAAIYVVTADDIRRSGVATIPDALRMVPGVHVARIDGNKWAISVRGFSSRFANKLLVLIDGRTVYTPSFSGVYWENQDVMLQDIDRIEVIRGPGAALWGSNGVNGVINITTKSTVDTQGNLLAARISTTDARQLGWRYGGKTSDGSAYRVYGKYLKTGQMGSEFGGTASDIKEMIRAGFRLDKSNGASAGLTLQGDIFASNSEQLQFDNQPTSPTYFEYIDDSIDERGGNVLGRWTSSKDNGGEFMAQFYIDYFERAEAWQDETRTTYDTEFQYRFASFANNRLILGGGYRIDDHRTRKTYSLQFDPEDRDSHIVNVFVQDEITLLDDRFNLVLGARFEHSDYSTNDVDIQPSIRASYQLNQKSSLWAAASRALRTASRAELEGYLHVATLVDQAANSVPVTVFALANNDLEPEQLTAYELGYRVAPLDTLTLDFALFKYNYPNLRSATLGNARLYQGEVRIDATFGNDGHAQSHGFEVAFDWSVSPAWHIKGAYSFIDLEEEQPGNENINSEPPGSQFNVRSQHNLSDSLNLDLWLRYVGDIEESTIEAYITLDARLGWRPRNNVELSLIGTNLFNDENREFLPEFAKTEEAYVRRSISAELVWEF